MPCKRCLSDRPGQWCLLFLAFLLSYVCMSGGQEGVESSEMLSVTALECPCNAGPACRLVVPLRAHVLVLKVAQAKMLVPTFQTAQLPHEKGPCQLSLLLIKSGKDHIMSITAGLEYRFFTCASRVQECKQQSQLSLHF